MGLPTYSVCAGERESSPKWTWREVLNHFVFSPARARLHSRLRLREDHRAPRRKRESWVPSILSPRLSFAHEPFAQPGGVPFEKCFARAPWSAQSFLFLYSTRRIDRSFDQLLTGSWRCLPAIQAWSPSMYRPG